MFREPPRGKRTAAMAKLLKVAIFCRERQKAAIHDDARRSRLSAAELHCLQMVAKLEGRT